MRILLMSSIDPDTVELLERRYQVKRAFNGTNGNLPALVRDREIVVFRSGVEISRDVIEAAQKLRLLIRAGSGLDNIDLESARENGVRIVRIPGPSAQAVAEFTFALMLSLVRNVTLADRLLRQAHWPKRELGGYLLSGKTLGIVGAGNIGSRVGELGAAWGMRPVGCVATPTPAVAAALARKGIELADFDTVVSTADIVSVHTPLDESTRHLIGADVLSKMRPGSFLLNLARGGVVDEEALYLALVEERLRGAALDVHEREGEGVMSRFAELPNVVLTPHIGAMALDSQREIGERLVELLTAFGAGTIDTATRDGELVL
jgi:D-3-phosphoglycerate dehydrogenase / 2-oxoglutarate reductase